MTKISQLSDIGANLAANDEFVVRDVSDASTPNKKVTASGIIDYVINQGSVSGFSQISAGSPVQSRVQCTSSGTDSNIIFTANAGEAARINDDRRLLVGTSVARTFAGGAIFVPFQVEGANDNNARGTSITYGINNTPGPLLCLGKHRSNTVGGSTIVASGDELGGIIFHGADGSNFIQAASIYARVNGTPGANNMPGSLVFGTTASGSSTVSDRMYIYSNGVVSIGAANNSGSRRLNVLNYGDTDTAIPTVLIERSTDAGGGSGSMEVGLRVNVPRCYNANSTTGISVYTGTNLETTSYAIDAQVATSNNGTYRAARFTGGHGNTIGYGTQGVVDVIANATVTGTNGAVYGMYIGAPNYSGANINLILDNATTASGTSTAVRFGRAGNIVGSITTTLTSTAFNTSSDYRLKENIVALENACERILNIPVHRFNFKDNPGRTVDGFLAHEVAPFVPESVTGIKDEVKRTIKMDKNNFPVLDEEGNEIFIEEPVYQSIDQSKLVPLLTAALQEAVRRIEHLESRLDAM